ncbi:hypothetical protein EVA_10748, partial [gut metagenome]
MEIQTDTAIRNILHIRQINKV